MLYVVTTATPRYELHELCCILTVSELSKHLDITWIINLDVPSLLNISDEYLETCKAKLTNVPTCKTILNVNRVNPNFSRAGKWVIDACFEQFALTDDDLFFWLEDDWRILNKYNNCNTYLNIANIIKTFTISESLFFVMGRNYYPSGHPSIFKYDSWKKMHELYTSPSICMEVIIFTMAKIVTGRVRQTHKSPRFPQKRFCIVMRIFVDRGRKWRDQRSIHKTKSLGTDVGWFI